MYEAIPKLKKISDLSSENQFIKVKLSNGRTIECQADCFSETEIEEDVFVEDLLVILEDGSREILIEDDIEEVVG